MNVDIEVVIILVPTIYLATLHRGQLALHGYGLFLNSAYLLIGVQSMYRRLLVAEKLQPDVNDVESHCQWFWLLRLLQEH